MKLYVYKGFNLEDLKKIKCKSLFDFDLENRIDPLFFTEDYNQNFIKLISTFSSDSWITYEEFSYLCNSDNGVMFQQLLKAFNIRLVLVLNNIYPGLYPSTNLSSIILDQTIREIEEENKEFSTQTKKILKIYNSIVKINDNYYVRYVNAEYDFDFDYDVENLYDDSDIKVDKEKETDFIFEITEDEVKYIEKINELIDSGCTNVGVKLMGDTFRIKELYKNICAFINYYPKYTLTLYDKYGYRDDLTDEFNSIVSDVLKVPNFSTFRDIDFYENPNLSNKLIKINQTQIMSDMVSQAEAAMKCEKLALDTNGKKTSGYRDVFVTAPTGAGKSLMFQIPAIYLAQKYNALTIIITPLIELMNDQVRNLHERGYLAAEKLNSTVNPIEKKKIVERISDGEINLLYLAPETLLSYPIDQLIGQRKIGLVIVDEAHIVSTWGKGFRPDYWYLGSYLERLRKFSDYRGLRQKDKKIYCFPICTFTATAVNGGIYDDVNDIKNSLNLRDTITYFGKVVRDNIKFDITLNTDESITNQDLYVKAKESLLHDKLENWIKKGDKTIVYFPYANTAHQAYEANSLKGFGMLEDIKENFAIYTGGLRNTSEEKSENMLDFRNGIKKVMFATKAFGMGIDIKDINNVYHYAVSGNLNDYVQEIGRVARSKDIPYGYAVTDYFKQDLKYMKTLYGMSALHNYQVKQILSIIYNVYESKKKYNMLVTPDMFKPVFPNSRDESELEVKIKTALLTIEKDLDNRYRGSKPLVTKPRNLFTECYVMINRKFEDKIMESPYGKYLKKIQVGRNRDCDIRSSESNKLFITDTGDIFSLNLKGLWEDMFDRMSFGEFKFKLNANPYDIFGEFSSFIYSRYRLVLKTLDRSYLSTLKQKLLEEINIVSEVLNEFHIAGIYFTKEEFAEKLSERYKSSFKASTVAGSYLDMLIGFRTVNMPSFCEIRNINGENKYLISRGHFRSLAEKIINESKILKKLRNIQASEYSSYEADSSNRNMRDNTFDAINLALLFGLVNFELIGGSRPEIFIRMNYPEKIRQIVKGEVTYNNLLVQQAKERHENDVAILNHFFSTFDDDTDRWSFIENYYLGRIMVNEGIVEVVEEF